MAGWQLRNRVEVMPFFLQPLLVIFGARPLAHTAHESLDRSMGAVTRRTAAGPTAEGDWSDWGQGRLTL